MLDDFFTRAIIAGIGVAALAGPLGCLIVWRRLAYFGDTLSHSALLGAALGFLFHINLTIAVFVVAACVAMILLTLQRRTSIPSDSLLGLLSHSTLAIGLVVLSLFDWVRVDLLAFLFGDILSVTRDDLLVIYGGGAIAGTVLVFFWRQLFASTVSPELAEAEGLKPLRANLIFMLLIATVIAVSLKIVGVMLIVALLLIPAATARRWASAPEQMAALASAFGITAVIMGLYGSKTWDTPSGPSIVVAALLLFILSYIRMPRISSNRAGPHS
ncbi:MAG: metal ABC transporter permease [Alphaproteobacteria bacterium]